MNIEAWVNNDMPLVRKQQIDLNKIKFSDYTKTKINDKENAHNTVHCVITIAYSPEYDEVNFIKQEFVNRIS